MDYMRIFVDELSDAVGQLLMERRQWPNLQQGAIRERRITEEEMNLVHWCEDFLEESLVLLFERQRETINNTPCRQKQDKMSERWPRQANLQTENLKQLSNAIVTLCVVDEHVEHIVDRLLMHNQQPVIGTQQVTLRMNARSDMNLA